jgi:tetratricopeptide (TPR) repeat protein
VAGDVNALVWALYQLAEAHRIKGEWDPYRANADRAVEAAERRGNPGPLQELVRARSTAAFYMGDWARARREAERVQACSDRLEDPYDTSALVPQARLALAEGQWELAARASAGALDMAHGSGRISDQREAQEVLAELDLRAGRAREAYARLAPVRDGPGVEERGVTPLRVLLAWAHLELGEHEAAQEVIADAMRRLRADDDRLGLVDALRVQALVQIGCRRWVEALASLRKGLALAGAMPYPYGEARLLHVYGAMLARRGEHEPAREHLEAALGIFRRLGARKDIEPTEQLLGSLG